MKDDAASFRGVVWLDRDGTVVDDPGYLADPAQLRLLDGAPEAIARLNAERVAVILITNQSGIARGKMSREDVDRIHRALERELERHGAHLDGIYLCPHLPAELLPPGEEPCDCRKPAPGLVERARRERGLAGLPSIVVGDKLSDLQLAATLGVPALLVRTGEGARTLQEFAAGTAPSVERAADLRAGVELILRTLGVRDGGSRR